MAISWKKHYSQRAQNLTASEIRELLKLVNRPGIISFAGGIPAAELFPFAEVEAAYQRIFADNASGARALQYSISEGYIPLRELVLEEMREAGLQLSLENVCVTCGSQQALEFLGKLLIDPHAPVVVENPTYLGALQAFLPYGPKYLTVRTDQDGIVPDHLETLLKQKPRFIYAISNFQNPSGQTISGERRRQIVELAHQYQVPIIEDNAYGALRYEGEALPGILEIDALQQQGKVDECLTIQTSSASKILAPGFRVAWVVAPKPVVQQLVMLKQGADLHTSTVNQMMVHELISQKEAFAQHLATLRREYGKRCKAMLDAIERDFPPGVGWTRPTGGMFVWVTLPSGIDTKVLLQQTLDEINVAFVPGEAFYADRSVKHAMRLNFSMMPPDKIEEGIHLLGGVLERVLATAG